MKHKMLTDGVYRATLSAVRTANEADLISIADLSLLSLRLGLSRTSLVKKSSQEWMNRVKQNRYSQ